MDGGDGMGLMVLVLCVVVLDVGAVILWLTDRRRRPPPTARWTGHQNYYPHEPAFKVQDPP
jgi:hypothetical protein